jgi:hypothetical protein
VTVAAPGEPAVALVALPPPSGGPQHVSVALAGTNGPFPAGGPAALPGTAGDDDDDDEDEDMGARLAQLPTMAWSTWRADVPTNAEVW